MIISFPPPPPGGLAGFLNQCLTLIRNAFSRTITKDEATPQIIFLDSLNVSWTISVTTAGALTTLRNDGKTRP